MLASDVNVFLNSPKQGLPCWHGLSFSFLYLMLHNAQGGYKKGPSLTEGFSQEM